MALTTGERTALRTAIDRELAALESRYGDNVNVESPKITRTKAGAINGLFLTVNVETPADVDGQTTRTRKEINIW